MGRFKGNYFILWLAVGGIVLSALVTYPVWQSDQLHREAIFDYRVAAHAVTVQQDLDEILVQLHYLRSYVRTEYVLESDGGVSRSGFDNVISFAMQDARVRPHVMAWAEPDADAVSIVLMSQNVSMSRNAGDGVYQGMDLLKNASLLALLNQARDSGQTALAIDQLDRSKVNLLMPVYGTVAPPQDIAARRTHLLGFVYGSWDIQSVIENSLKLLPVAGIDVIVSDTSTRPEQVIYRHLSRSRDSDAGVKHAALQNERVFHMADRSWRLYFAAASGFYDDVPLQRTWQVLLGCLLLTLLVAVAAAVVRANRLATQELLQQEKLQADLKVAKAEKDTLNMKMQVQHTDRLESLGVMAGGIAHDFNNILTAIMGNAGLARSILADEHPKVSSYLMVIEDSSMRAADLCRQMLAYSGKGHFIIEPVNLTDEISSMKGLLVSSVAKKVVIDYQLDEQVPCIRADRTQISQIMLNLVVNASEAIEEADHPAGRITVSTGMIQASPEYFASFRADTDLPSGAYAFLEISDDGCGMNDETLTKIYDPFFTTKFTGRGLGMSAILGIVRGHRGAIRIYSEIERGTVFRLLFPCVDLQAVVPLHYEHIALDTAGFGQGRRVLVVDDEVAVRQLISSLLGRMGFQVLLANDGQHGLGMFRQYQDDIALVVLDYAMPVMDGFECFAEIQRLQPDAKVLLSSGYNEADATKRFSGKTLVGFIQKPYLAQEFEQKIIEVLGTLPDAEEI